LTTDGSRREFIDAKRAIPLAASSAFLHGSDCRTRANARQLPSVRPAVLKRRPPPSRRAPQTTMPYHISLRLAGLWLAALGFLLALVLAIRWYA
jgi:hypothetical protein